MSEAIRERFSLDSAYAQKRQKLAARAAGGNDAVEADAVADGDKEAAMEAVATDAGAANDDGEEEEGVPKVKIAQSVQFKVVPDTQHPILVVDGFQRRVRNELPKDAVHFLSHFHADHYGGLQSTWADGPIYCSHITACLVKEFLGVAEEYLHVLPLHTPTVIHGTTVTCYDANHCPGAFMFLFDTGKSRTLHVGDFRFHPKMKQYPGLDSLQPRAITHLYLDTTFNDAKFCFPPQEEVVATAVRLCRQVFEEFERPLVVFGSYSIGKERVFMACAEALNLTIYASARKRRALELCGYDMNRFVDTPEEAGIQVGTMGQSGFNALSARSLRDDSSRHDAYVGFTPTGWTWTRIAKRTAAVKPWTLRQHKRVYAYGLPYSEHSSYTDLLACAEFIRPVGIVPTVHNGGHSREAIEKQKVPFHPYIDMSKAAGTIVSMFSTKQQSEPRIPVVRKRPSETPANGDQAEKQLRRSQTEPAPGLIQRSITFFFGGK